MLKENCKVKVHFCDCGKYPSFDGETITRKHDEIFEVKNHNGKIDSEDILRTLANKSDFRKKGSRSSRRRLEKSPDLRPYPKNNLSW